MQDNAEGAAPVWRRCKNCGERILFGLDEELGREVWASERELAECLEPFCRTHWERGQEPHEPTDETFISNMEELCNFFSADEPRLLNHRIYKDTACGASISLYFEDADPLHNGRDPRWTSLTFDSDLGLIGFTIQTIVEGSDAEVNSDLFKLPVLKEAVETWFVAMEAEADALWHEANDDDPELIDGGEA